MFIINIWATLSTASQLDAESRPPIASCAYYLSAPPVHHRRRYRQTRGLIRLQFLLNIDQKKTTSSPISLLPPLLTFNPALLSLLYPFPLLLLCHFYFYSISNICDSFCSISWEDQMMVSNGGKKSNRNRPCDSWSMALDCKDGLIDKKYWRAHSHFWSYICSESCGGIMRFEVQSPKGLLPLPLPGEGLVHYQVSGAHTPLSPHLKSPPPIRIPLSSLL